MNKLARKVAINNRPFVKLGTLLKYKGNDNIDYMPRTDDGYSAECWFEVLEGNSEKVPYEEPYRKGIFVLLYIEPTFRHETIEDIIAFKMTLLRGNKKIFCYIKSYDGHSQYGHYGEGNAKEPFIEDFFTIIS